MYAFLRILRALFSKIYFSLYSISKNSFDADTDGDYCHDSLIFMEYLTLKNVSLALIFLSIISMTWGVLAAPRSAVIRTMAGALLLVIGYFYFISYGFHVGSSLGALLVLMLIIHGVVLLIEFGVGYFRRYVHRMRDDKP